MSDKVSIDELVFGVAARPIDLSRVEDAVANYEVVEQRFVLDGRAELDDCADGVIAEDAGLPGAGVLGGANRTVHRVHRDGMYLDEEIILPEFRLRQVDVDEYAIVVDRASTAVSDGFHVPSFLFQIAEWCTLNGVRRLDVVS